MQPEPPREPAASLANEAKYLHRAFFHSEPPIEVVDRYIAANAVCGIAFTSLLDRVVALQLDPEAIEFVLRIRQGPTALTTKTRILFYLVEVRSAYYGYFVGDQESRPRAAWGLARAVFQAAGKYLKGAYLVRRYGLV